MGLSAAAAHAARIESTPRLVPSFRPSVVDYVTSCRSDRPVRLRVTTDGRTRTHDESLKPGQAASVVVESGEKRRRYHVRCLPADFPRWRFERFRRPQAQFFLFTPQDGVADPESHYVILIDGHGTPIWWRKRGAVPFNSTLLPNGQVAWARWYEEPFGISRGTAWEIHTLDGRLVRTLEARGSPTDLHDLQPLGHGRFLLLTYRVRRHVDLRPYGGPANGAVVDGEIQEQDADGNVVWRWNSKDHVSIGENYDWPGPYREVRDGTEVFDYFHLNSVQPDGDGYVISARHVNAIYRIDRATGAVTWKLGGTERPESLRVIGDHRTHVFRGQHDARLLPDGTLTVFDNHTATGKPRAMRLRIDAAKGTARLLEQVTEPRLTWSPAEGSARKLPGGDWVVSWGANKLISELRATNDPTWRLTLARGQSFRITPVLRGTLSASRLRRAMDEMHPR